ncbi:MAG TPA: winged helix-turn-helix domain-containing protein [Anaerolineales bacterium]|jgi:transposase|nr:winged helix-turn-helix domain-containing protein [Anaerolineales bacterium]HQX17476.1 winged helix-turn-helix domain-containing protein [Anaerolineales bacterium]
MSKDKPQTTNWKERRRFHALKLKRKKWKQKDIATALDVSEGAVSQWLKTATAEGEKSLQARLHTGRTPELTFAQKQLIPDFLSHGAEAYGFRGEVWTCSRIRKVIEWEFSVSYHKSHVARLMKDLKWTPQMPVERAIQRNELAIAQWRSEVWVEMKKKRVWSAESLFLWTNRAFTFYPQPSEHMHRLVKHPWYVFFKQTIIYPS